MICLHYNKSLLYPSIGLGPRRSWSLRSQFRRSRDLPDSVFEESLQEPKDREQVREVQVKNDGWNVKYDVLWTLVSVQKVLWTGTTDEPSGGGWGGVGVGRKPPQEE